MTAAALATPGDAGRYACPHCPSEYLLDELLDHLEQAHGRNQ